MNIEEKNSGNITGVFLSAALIILVLLLDLFDAGTGIIVLLAYMTAALLFMSGHFKTLIIIFFTLVTGLIMFLAIAGDSMGIFKGGAPVFIVLLWLVILAFAFEYLFLSGAMGFEKIQLYRQYLLLSLVQSTTLLLSAVILMLGPHLAGTDKNIPQAVILNSCTLLMMLFFISFSMFVSYLFKSLFNPGFMSDFARALYDAGRDREYDDRKQGIKTSGADYDFLKTFRRMRLITYLLFAASLAGLFFISKTRVIDRYAGAVAGRSVIIDFVIYVIKNPPPVIVFLMKAVFFIVDLLIIKDVIKMLGAGRLKKWLKELYATVQN